jgi:hypothetical protein
MRHNFYCSHGVKTWPQLNLISERRGVVSSPYDEMDLSCGIERGAVQLVLSITMKGFQNCHWTLCLCSGFCLVITSSAPHSLHGLPSCLKLSTRSRLSCWSFYLLFIDDGTSGKSGADVCIIPHNSLVRNPVLGKHRGESRQSKCS